MISAGTIFYARHKPNRFYLAIDDETQTKVSSALINPAYSKLLFGSVAGGEHFLLPGFLKTQGAVCLHKTVDVLTARDLIAVEALPDYVAAHVIELANRKRMSDITQRNLFKKKRKINLEF